MSSAAQETTIYEHPLNEKMWTFLRLEHLFLQVNYHLPQQDIWGSRATVDALLDMANIFSRADIKADLIKELDRHREKLANMRQGLGVDTERLDQILKELEKATSSIYQINGQIGHNIRSNEFLKTIMQRSSIPGATCAFDLPQYHYWLELPHEQRQRDLDDWLHSLDSIHVAVTLLLSLVRGSTDPTREMAAGGFFQRSLAFSLHDFCLLTHARHFLFHVFDFSQVAADIIRQYRLLIK